MFYQYLLKKEEIDEEVVDQSLTKYVYEGRMMGATTDKIKKKAKKIIYYSLETTKTLLKYGVKTALNFVLPPIAKEISNIGINVIVELIEKYLNKEEFEEFNKAKCDITEKLSDDAKSILDLILSKGKKTCKKQKRKLKSDLKEMVDIQKEKEKIKEKEK